MNTALRLTRYLAEVKVRIRRIDMGDVPVEEEEAGDSLYDVDGLSPGGQVYTNTELGKYAYRGLHYLSVYGWYVVLVVVCVGLVWMKVGPQVRVWWKRKREKEEELNFDPVKAERYQDGMLRARERMQRELEEKALEHQEKMEERASKERDEKIEQWESFGVVTKSKKPKKRFDPPPRRDYFPLMGHGGGSGYRPARRNVGGGG